MEIADVGVDHTADDNFFAARVLILGENNHSLEAGWVEGEFWGDTDQHIYSQDSHTCRRGSCTWADFDSTCDNSRHDAQIAIAAVSSTRWRSSCWDGNSWNVMHNNINLGDDDSERMEVFGEIYRTVSGGMSLTSSGINFRAIEVRDGSDWEDWTTSVNTTAWGDDAPYDYEPVRNYTEFNVKNE
ncbi:MAG: hypothetical protein F4Y44_11145 [Chloroflexi bacterium]|nr:hypothetical protein [Chloroflexota bacterium]